MCTLTFIPRSNGFILTSNRDEAPGRATVPPQTYTVDGVELTFPKDEVAGGTWIGISEKDRLVCLLNGGFRAHQREDSYRLSRGLVVRDLLVVDDVMSAIEEYDLLDVEPFTLIIVQWESEIMLYELVWDGVQKHVSRKSMVPAIWSSSLLYTSEMKRERERWFSQFLEEYPNPTASQLLHFHKTAGTGDLYNDLIMDRGVVKTKSITQIVKSQEESSMSYQEIS